MKVGIYSTKDKENISDTYLKKLKSKGYKITRERRFDYLEMNGKHYYIYYIELNTMDEIKDIMQTCERRLVFTEGYIDSHSSTEDYLSLEIYDDYRE